MQQNNETIWVGFITYGETTLKYLPYFLDSLACQTDVTLKIVCVDNTDGPSANLDYLADRREVEVISKGSNQGFGKAYNIMLTAANKAGAEYFFIVNPDVILAPDCLKRLIVALQKNQALSSVCPKLRRWDFEKKDKTEFIDSCGIVLRPSLQFFDLGQGEIDKGQYDSAEILGPSGAAGLFKMSALNSIKEGEQYFDEHFFMYKEDCDLTMRLNLKGGKSELVPLALAYHDRTASGFGEGFLARINARRSKSR
ncbi:glycosyltransferase, partial [Candidatus Falkowbacteria bacterium]|nr:glycosyltransferase [Candidatus Falkowbacteria bacterium]